MIEAFRFTSQWEEVFNKVDLDGNGKIDFHEFIAGAVDHHKMLTKNNLKFAFNLFDQNSDGVIDLTEFKNALPTHRGTTIKEHPGSINMGLKHNGSSSSSDKFD